MIIKKSKLFFGGKFGWTCVSFQHRLNKQHGPLSVRTPRKILSEIAIFLCFRASESILFLELVRCPWAPLSSDNSHLTFTRSVSLVSEELSVNKERASCFVFPLLSWQCPLPPPPSARYAALLPRNRADLTAMSLFLCCWFTFFSYSCEFRDQQVKVAHALRYVVT